MSKKTYKYCVICKAISNDVPSFGFPDDPSIRKLWTDFCQVTLIGNRKKLCLKHFDKEDIQERQSKIGGPSSYRLKKDAVPKYFPNEVSKTVSKRKSRPKCCFLCDCKDQNLSYFTFPRDIELRIKWIEFCEYPAEDAYILGRKVWLCERHFDEEDIIRKKDCGKTFDHLFPDAIPKIYTPGAPPPVPKASDCLTKCERFSSSILKPEVDPLHIPCDSNGSLSPDNVTVEPDIPNFFCDDEEKNSGASIDISYLLRIIHNNCTKCTRFIQHITNPPKKKNVHIVPHSSDIDNFVDVVEVSEFSDSSISETNSVTDNLANDSTANTSIDDSDSVLMTMQPISRSRRRRIAFVGDIKSQDLATPKRARHAFQLAKTELLKSRRKINQMQKKMYRLQSAVKRYSGLVKEFQSEKLSENAALGLLDLQYSN